MTPRNVIVNVCRKDCEEMNEEGRKVSEAIRRLTGLDEPGVDKLIRFILILSAESVRSIRYDADGLIVGFEADELKEEQA